MALRLLTFNNHSCTLFLFFYYLYVLKPVYVHDDSKCSEPFFWEKPSTPLHNFNMNFIDEVFELMISSISK